MEELGDKDDDEADKEEVEVDEIIFTCESDENLVIEQIGKSSDQLSVRKMFFPYTHIIS